MPQIHFIDDYDGADTVQSESSSASFKEILFALPEQSHSINDGILQLRFHRSYLKSNPHKPLVINLAVDAAPGCGGVAWPAGQVLASYLVHRGPDFVSGRNTLELGSGTGLVGLVTGLLGGRVCMTDQAPLLDTMRRNVQMNDLESEVSVAVLNWGEPIHKDIPPPNLILAADCVYFEPAFPLLVQTLVELSDSETEILFCYKKRRKADKRFFTLLKKKFSWKEVMDDPNRSVYSREAISFLRLYKNKSSDICKKAARSSLGI